MVDMAMILGLATIGLTALGVLIAYRGSKSRRRTGLGFFDWLESRSEKREAKQHTLADLEGEVNRHITAILLKGGQATHRLTAMLEDLPRRHRSDPIKRASVVYSVEVAHGLPDPLDLHAFINERYAFHMGRESRED
jgi:hypothetical protein